MVIRSIVYIVGSKMGGGEILKGGLRGATHYVTYSVFSFIKPSIVTNI